MISRMLITGGAPADPDPRATPAVPPDRIIALRERIAETDQQPASLVLALEGTAGNTCSVRIYGRFEEPGPSSLPSDQRWYALHAVDIVVTVGQAVRAPALPGGVYVRVNTASAADSVLIARVMAQPFATPVA